MSHLKRSVQVLGIAAATLAGVMAPCTIASAGTPAGHLVFVVEDQAGGAYYNVTTGERFDVTALSAVPTLGIAGVQAASGVVLSTTGQLFEPVGQVSGDTPLATVVSVAETTTNGSFVDVTDQTQWVLTTERAALPTENESALLLADGTILTVANHVLIPVEKASGLTP